jgi:hypothetical protein
MMKMQHQNDVEKLEKEIQDLKKDCMNKDMKLEVLEKHQNWLDNFQRDSVHNFNHNFHHDLHGFNVPNVSSDLLHELKIVLESLRKDVASLSLLQPHMFRESLNTDILLSEIASVQSIYKQLEEGVEKNSRLHQVLLNSLRGDNRQSDSPDSNSCQDGGYNLISVSHQDQGNVRTCHADSTSPTSLELGHLGQDESWAQIGGDNSSKDTGSGSVGGVNGTSGATDKASCVDVSSRSVDACAEVIDRSLQTGPAFSQVDQWVQTSPKSDATHNKSQGSISSSGPSPKALANGTVDKQQWLDQRKQTLVKDSPQGILRGTTVRFVIYNAQ